MEESAAAIVRATVLGFCRRAAPVDLAIVRNSANQLTQLAKQAWQDLEIEPKRW